MKPQVVAAIIIVILIPLAVFAMYKVNDSQNNESEASPSPAATATATPTPTPAGDSANDQELISAKRVVLKTEKGDIHLTLYPEEAPKAVQNFVTLGKRGYYNGVVFHRVSKDFMIQGGDPQGTGSGGQSVYGKDFELEQSGHKFVKGSLGMASRGGNTLGSQFFIMTTQAYPSLDGLYTNFGQVEDDASQQVVQAIGNLEIGQTEKPSQLIKITGFEIVE